MYNAFISYSHTADGRMAPALQHGLLRYAIPWYKPSKLNIFRDESNLSVTPHLWDNIEKALANSSFLIFMASPESSNSKWVTKELDYWIKNKSIDKLIIVVTAGEIGWDEKTKSFHNTSQTCIPPILENVFSQEPFYVDLRALKSRNDLSLKNSIFNKEVLKIAAELYGKSQKELAGEEVRTRNSVKRLSATFFIILLAAFITTFYFYDIADKANTKVSNLLQIALQGRGEQYRSKPLDTVIAILENERIRPLKELIKPRATRERVGETNNYDYMIWIEVPSFRTDSIIEVSYEWEPDGYRYVRGNKMFSREPSTGYAFGYRGINAIKDYIDITILLKGDKKIEKRFQIRDSLNILYKLNPPYEIESKSAS